MEKTTGLGKEGVATGGNSGYQATNLAYLLGATEIYLLGFDMRPKGNINHFHGNHDRRTVYNLTNPNTNLYRTWIKNFARLHQELQQEGVSLINCSRESALTIPMKSLESVLNEPPIHT
jgi:hypothetical protein